MDTVKFSTNLQWVGKPETRIEQQYKNGALEVNAIGMPVMGKSCYNHLNKRVSLGFNWENQTLTWTEAFEAIAVLGLPVAPYLTPDAAGNRKRETFASHSLVMVDIDNGMKIEELLQNPLYVEFGAGYYTSPSHTEEHHKFRIMFRLKHDITNPADMNLMYNWMLGYFKSGDAACKDAARYFNGSVNASRSERTDKVLFKGAVDQMILQQKEKERIAADALLVLQQAAAAKQQAYGTDSKLDLEAIKNIIKAGNFDFGEYHTFAKFGCVMRLAGFSLHDLEEVAPFVSKSKAGTCSNYYYTKLNNITVGSLFHMLKLSKPEIAQLYLK